MSKFEEINGIYEQWRSRYFDDRRTAMAFAQRFANEFRKYIEAPEKVPPTFGGQSVDKYVWACRAILDEETQTYQAQAQSNLAETVQINPVSGRWYFALAVRCEMAPNAWPKEWFPVLVLLEINDADSRLLITLRPQGSFSIQIDDHKTWTPAFDYVIELLREQFSRRQHVDRKEIMGFAIPATPQPEVKQSNELGYPLEDEDEDEREE